MSLSRWIITINAKGFMSKRRKYDGGTFAHPDIALEFASWIDSAFNLKGNIRDYMDILHLVVLSNLEVINASMIDNNVSQKERLEKLNILSSHSNMI